MSQHTGQERSLYHSWTSQAAKPSGDKRDKKSLDDIGREVICLEKIL